MVGKYFMNNKTNDIFKITDEDNELEVLCAIRLYNDLDCMITKSDLNKNYIQVSPNISIESILR